MVFFTITIHLDCVTVIYGVEDYDLPDLYVHYLWYNNRYNSE